MTIKNILSFREVKEIIISNPVNKSIVGLKGSKRKSNIKKKYMNNNSPYVSIVLVTNRPDMMKNIFDNYNRQTYQNKELIIIINNNKINRVKWVNESTKYENIHIYNLDENISLGKCLNYGVDKSRYDIIAKFDDDDYYGPKYLEDSITQFKRVKADVIGKRTSFVYFDDFDILATRFSGYENKYVSHIDGPTLIFNKYIFNKVRFKDIPNAVDVEICKDLKKNGFKLYSINKYHHAYIRKKSKSHTWKIDNSRLLKLWCVNKVYGVKDYTKYVDI